MSLLDQSLSLLSQSDTFAVIEFLDQQDDSLLVASTYAELVKHLYWKEKDIPPMVALARAGIQYALAMGTAVSSTDIALTMRLRGEAKTIAYNLASFTWTGWDEPGVVLTGSDQCHGLEAAHLNLRLAFELDKGDMRISRGYWMKAAHLLAAGKLAAASLGFRKSLIYAVRAGSEPGRLIARGFVCLVACLQDPRDTQAEQELAEVKREFKDHEHGRTYIDQLNTARRVFGKNESS